MTSRVDQIEEDSSITDDEKNVVKKVIWLYGCRLKKKSPIDSAKEDERDYEVETLHSDEDLLINWKQNNFLTCYFGQGIFETHRQRCARLVI